MAIFLGIFLPELSGWIGFGKKHGHVWGFFLFSPFVVIPAKARMTVAGWKGLPNLCHSGIEVSIRQSLIDEL